MQAEQGTQRRDRHKVESTMTIPNMLPKAVFASSTHLGAVRHHVLH